MDYVNIVFVLFRLFRLVGLFGLFGLFVSGLFSFSRVSVKRLISVYSVPLDEDCGCCKFLGRLE